MFFFCLFASHFLRNYPPSHLSILASFFRPTHLFDVFSFSSLSIHALPILYGILVLVIANVYILWLSYLSFNSRLIPPPLSRSLSHMNIYLRTFISFLLDVWCLVLFIICNNFLPPVRRPLSNDPHFKSCKITSMALALEMLVAAGSVHWPAHSTLHKGEREKNRSTYSLLTSSILNIHHVIYLHNGEVAMATTPKI